MVERSRAFNVGVRPRRQSHQFLQELTHGGHTGFLLGTAYLDVSLSEIVLVQPSRVDSGQSVAQRCFDHADALILCHARSMSTGFKPQSSAGTAAAARPVTATSAEALEHPAPEVSSSNCPHYAESETLQLRWDGKSSGAMSDRAYQEPKSRTAGTRCRNRSGDLGLTAPKLPVVGSRNRPGRNRRGADRECRQPDPDQPADRQGRSAGPTSCSRLSEADAEPWPLAQDAPSTIAHRNAERLKTLRTQHGLPTLPAFWGDTMFWLR